MKTIFHQTNAVNKTLSHGLIINEQKPQRRCLNIRYAFPVFNRLFLPYLYFIVNYERHYDKYIYRGSNGDGLRMAASLKPIKNFESKVLSIPTEWRFNPVCTNHAYDNTYYENVENLVNTAAGLWYTAEHSIYGAAGYGGNINDWKAVETLEEYELLEVKKLTLKQVINDCSSFATKAVLKIDPKAVSFTKDATWLKS